MRHNGLIAALCAAVISFAPGPVIADGAFGVAPVKIEFSPDSRSASITITNRETEERVMEIQILAWRQEDGKDVVEPTNDVIAAPPIFTLGPLQAQTIRLALIHRLQSEQETAFRLIVKEVPSQLVVARFGAITSLEFNLPVFVDPSLQSHREATWSIAEGNAGNLRLSLVNPTNVHMHINSLQVRLPSGQTVTVQGERYALAGSTVSWDVKDDGHAQAGSTVKVMALLDNNDRRTMTETIAGR